MLNLGGAWATVFQDGVGGARHWVVVVDDINGAGRVKIRDPWEGTKYTMTYDDFDSVWTGHSVYRE